MSSKVDKKKWDIALCPVRALIEYRARSNEYRSPSQRTLLIAVNKKHSTDITRATLSRWLKTVIRRAYLNLHQEGKPKSTTPSNPHWENESSWNQKLGSYHDIKIYFTIQSNKNSILTLTYDLHQTLSQRGRIETWRWHPWATHYIVAQSLFPSENNPGEDPFPVLPSISVMRNEEISQPITLTQFNHHWQWWQW